MKYLFLVLIPAFIMSCGSRSGGVSALAYNDSIVNAQNKIIVHILAMSSEAMSLEDAEAHRLRVIEQCDASISFVSAMEPFDGNSDLRDAAIDLFKFYKEIATLEFKEMLEIVWQEWISDADYERLDLLDAQITRREEPLDAAFEKAQMDFIAKHNLQLKKNQYQDAIDGL